MRLTDKSVQTEDTTRRTQEIFTPSFPSALDTLKQTNDDDDADVSISQDSDTFKLSITE